MFMKLVLLAFALFFSLPAYAETPEISIPEHDIALIKTTDFVEVNGTNTRGGKEDFAVRNWKAISQFVELLTSARYIAVPKNLDPHFKSLSRYKVRLSSKGKVVLELQIVADSVLDIPNDPSFYMQSQHHSDILLAPLLRLR
jgi:hypothetical protein